MKLKLFHGSKSGIIGTIRPNSRECCDFGSGFYMGDSALQPQTLICREKSPKFYELELDDTGLTYLNFQNELNWALFVAFNRGEMNQYTGTPLEAKLSLFKQGIDLIQGRIADDRVFFAVQRFFDGLITIETLAIILKALNYSNQIVAITQRACDAIKIISERTLNANECENLRQKSDMQRSRALSLTTTIMRNQRHQNGRYFDEVCTLLANGEDLI